MWGYVGFNRVGIGYILPPVVSEFHLEFWQASLLISGTAATQALSGWIGGVWSDRVGRKPVLLIGMYASTVFSALFGAGQSFLWLFVARDLVGLGEGLAFTTGQSSIAEATNPSRRALYQGIFNAGYGVIGLGLGALVMTQLATAFGWRLVYPILAIFGVAVLTAVAVLLPARTGLEDGRQREAIELRRFWTELMAVLRTPGVPPVVFGTTIVLSWVGLASGFGSLFLTRVRSYSLDEAGAVFAIAGLIGFTGTIFVPAASDVVGRRTAVAAAAAVGGLGYLGFVLIDGGTPVAIALLTIANFGIGGISSILGATILSEHVPDRRGAAIGVNVFFAAVVGTMVMPLVGGLAADRFGLAAPLGIAGLLVLLIVPAVLAMPETAPRVLARRASTPTVPSDAVTA
jgi:MFS family permease